MFNAILFAALGYLVGNTNTRQKVEQTLMSGFKNNISKIKDKAVGIIEQSKVTDEFNPINTEKI